MNVRKRRSRWQSWPRCRKETWLGMLRRTVHCWRSIRYLSKEIFCFTESFAKSFGKCWTARMEMAQVKWHRVLRSERRVNKNIHSAILRHFLTKTRDRLYGISFLWDKFPPAAFLEVSKSIVHQQVKLPWVKMSTLWRAICILFNCYRKSKAKDQLP